MPQTKIRRYLRHGMLPQLAVFEAVVRLGSFTRAAEELYMAQPTVSVQIKKLTETIGVPLIEQVGKTIRLTPVGKELQAACGEIFQTFTRFEQNVRLWARGLVWRSCRASRQAWTSTPISPSSMSRASRWNRIGTWFTRWASSYRLSRRRFWILCVRKRNV